MGQNIRILIADARPLEREGISSIIRQSLRNIVIYEACNFASITDNLERNPSISIIVFDVRLPELGGLAGIKSLVSQYCGICFLAVGESLSRDAALSILTTGVQGYLPRSLEAIHVAEAFNAILNGRIYLPPTNSFASGKTNHDKVGSMEEARRIFTDRQFEVLGLLIEGKSNKEIARSLNISESTVKVHVNASFRSLGVHNRRSAIEIFNQSGDYADPTDHHVEKTSQIARKFGVIHKFAVNAAFAIQCILMNSEEYMILA